ncbi:MAG TPA: FliI/YscN family ATPase [Sphingomonas sp.]|jgi:flagellum-specific ATP synthase|nr:FliI/YscN family ATPase [Sphingomonas sp.]
MMQHRFLAQLGALALVRPEGEVRRVTAGRIEATGPATLLGALCRIGDGGMLAQVAAVDAQGIVLVPLEDGAPVALGARVSATALGANVGVGNGYAGRAVDALCRPIDGKGTIDANAQAPLRGGAWNTLDRAAPTRVLATGVRAIDGLLTLGEGQRIGIFAASGVGKTSLIEQIATGTQSASGGATRCILCLVGERGREVEGFWRTLSARHDARRFTIVAATSDESAAMRARCVGIALAIAEHWRDAGEHVLLIIDSVTRLAMALREIGLAAGEPPTVRAYTPGVFAALPRVVERCGAARGGGAITAVMTVLSETDEVDDPIAETMKSLLDGHIVLSRTLAERGHFPAIDVTRSVSRQAARLMEPAHRTAARAVAAQLGIYEESRVMIQSGIYQAGSAPEVDAAIAGRDALMTFLQQGQDEWMSVADTVRRLTALGTGRG